MTWGWLVDEAAALSRVETAVLGGAAGFLLVLAVGVQLSARRMRQELSRAEEELVDRSTGLLPRSALRVRLGAEIAWAATSRTPIAVASLRLRGGKFRRAAQVLRESMREEESGFLLGDDRVIVELWGADPHAASAATRRLGEHLAAAGHPVVDVGLACSPRDGHDVETLVRAAGRDLRPIDDPGDERALGRGDSRRGAHAWRTLLAALPTFIASSLLLLLAWRLLPAAVEPAIGGGVRTNTELVYALIAAIGLPVGAALLHLTSWNVEPQTIPRSRPLSFAGWRAALAVAVIVGVPLSWGVFAPTEPPELADGFGATLAVLALLVLAIFNARQLVHVVPVLLLLGVAAGAGTTWWAVEEASRPLVANAGRLLLAVALGALLARAIERASWLVLLAALAAAIDTWSVLSPTGPSNRLLQQGEGDRLLELVLFTGPSVDGGDLFAIGTTDLVFLAMFLSWAHDWRLDLRVVGAALLTATWGGVITAEVLAVDVPLLPALSAAVALVVIMRALVLQRRHRAWQGRGRGGMNQSTTGQSISG